jgi:hypothetical protein
VFLSAELENQNRYGPPMNADKRRWKKSHSAVGLKTMGTRFPSGWAAEARIRKDLAVFFEFSRLSTLVSGTQATGTNRIVHGSVIAWRAMPSAAGSWPLWASRDAAQLR